ncbi:hypothetical protein LK09_07675 [Microbacterium mangrovi]|uniref:Uncharacterized protein n=1 Tax=Microbacterium mangrovi TaxID=1348253 RepID=A0A0B2A6U1_9MICO|nr:hypothetical protein [Microbacterium mangrovi]KHK98775.1 hypothetical protein LK09_07675 [Microbacterium mangrovi]
MSGEPPVAPKLIREHAPNLADPADIVKISSVAGRTARAGSAFALSRPRHLVLNEILLGRANEAL